MRVLVFGHSGQVASSFRAVTPLFPDIDVITLGHDVCDVTNFDQVSSQIKELKPDLLVNAAAYTAVDRAEDEVEAAFLLNETAVKNIAQAKHVPIIHLSTDYVFNGQKMQPYQVEDKVHPLGVYGQSKWVGEEVLRKICSKHLILRTAWVYSPFGANFVKTMLRIMAANDQIKVVNDQRGCPTSALDLAHAILKISPQVIDPSFEGFGTYHLVSNGDISWHDLACEIQRQAKLECDVLAIPSADYPTKAARPAYSVLSPEKFEQTFAFHLPDWQDSLSLCLKNLKEAGEL